ncbi:hypothetical protein BASA62_001919 [Batrachochytrium salamandrivorans]|nr:hypothetical protein BASA62_001919 [Batrachochytrium salamandrivorans]
MLLRGTTELGLEESFQGWFSMTILHVWIMNARLRGEGASGKDMKQEVFNHSWLDVEIKLHQAGVKTRISQILLDCLIHTMDKL